MRNLLLFVFALGAWWPADAQEPPKKFTPAQIKYSREYAAKNKDTQDPLQMFLIGVMHWRGMTGKVDRKTAFDFFTRASKVPKPGNEQAALVLAQIYLNGEKHETHGVPGIKKDAKKAAALCRQSAERGFLPAIGGMAPFYEGGIGVEKDLVKALAWHKVTQQRHPLKKIERG